MVGADCADSQEQFKGQNLFVPTPIWVSLSWHTASVAEPQLGIKVALLAVLLVGGTPSATLNPAVEGTF